MMGISPDPAFWLIVGDYMVSNFSSSGHTPHIGVLINPLSGGNQNGLEDVRRLIYDHPQVLHCDVQTPDEVVVRYGGPASFLRI
jgi:hypothetical protein